MTPIPSPRPPRVAALHDLSCFGRCALTVILPALSAMGLQVVPLPTALLSTHTGGFDDMTFRDLSEDMSEIAAHFSRLGVEFEAVYSGFLGSAAQIETVSGFISDFRRAGKTLVLVDPVMGDDGALYSTYNDALVAGMRRLCAHADLITPNLTEACLLTDTPYRPTRERSEAEVRAFAATLFDRLAALGAPEMVITGLEHDGDRVSCACRTPEGDGFVTCERLDESYPGTGDLFASVLLGKRMGGTPTADAVRFAADYVSRVIAHSARIPTPHREGVALEACLRELIEMNERKELPS